MSEAKRSTFAEELAQGRTITYFTIGVSMRPLLIERQTHVMIAPIEAAAPGDIVLYLRQNGAYVLHRCMRVDGEFYLMRGDNTYGLEKIARSQALGVVTHIYRRGRRFAVDNRRYRAYVAFWHAIYPARWLVWRGKSLLRRLFR